MIDTKLYVGVTGNLERRWKTHQQLGRSDHGKHYRYPLYVAMREYGVDSFFMEIKEVHPDKDYMYGREHHWIKKLNALVPYGYNVFARKLSDEEAAIVRYDAYGLTTNQYARLFDTFSGVIQQARSNDHQSPYRFVTLDDLPAH